MGPSARLVYLHGALVWAAMLLLFVSAGLGALAFLRRSEAMHRVSRALGRAGMLWWALYIPVSVAAAMATWAGGAFNLAVLLEPRFATAFQVMALCAIALAVQYIDKRPQVGSLGNIAIVVIMVVLLGLTERILHPPAPMAESNAPLIQLAFGAMTALIVLMGVQLSRFGWPAQAAQRAEPELAAGSNA